MADDPPPHLRVLIADENQRRIAEIAGVISGLGHTVVARLLDVSEIADATRQENPDGRSSESTARASRVTHSR